MFTSPHAYWQKVSKWYRIVSLFEGSCLSTLNLKFTVPRTRWQDRTSSQKRGHLFHTIDEQKSSDHQFRDRYCVSNYHQLSHYIFILQELTYPTLGNEMKSSKVPWEGILLGPMWGQGVNYPRWIRSHGAQVASTHLNNWILSPSLGGKTSKVFETTTEDLESRQYCWWFRNPAVTSWYGKWPIIYLHGFIHPM